MDKLLELENILNKEVETFGALENLLADKKNHLINADVKSLQSVDIKIEEIAQRAEKIQKERLELSEQPLKEIIEKIKDKDLIRAKSLLNIRKKIVEKTKNIHKLNEINIELIKHAQKLIEGDISSIIAAVTPTNNLYNNQGKAHQETKESVSSVIRRA